MPDSNERDWTRSDYIALGLLFSGLVLFLIIGMQLAGTATVLCAFFSWTRGLDQNRAKGNPTIGRKGQIAGAWVTGTLAVLFILTHGSDSAASGRSANTDVAPANIGQSPSIVTSRPKEKLSADEASRKVKELVSGERQMKREDVEGRLIFWDEIISLAPGNAEYSKQRDAVQREVDALAPFREQPQLGGVITKFKGRKDGFGNVLVIDITLYNRSRANLVDFEIACENFGNSGTSLGNNTKVLYEMVEGRSEKAFRGINMGFIDPQTKRSSCSIIRALIG